MLAVTQYMLVCLCVVDYIKVLMEQIHCGCKYCIDNALVNYSHWVNRILNPLGPKLSSFLLKLSRVSYSHWVQNANFEYTLNTHIEYLLSMQSTFWVSLCTLGEWLHILKLSKKLLDFGPMDWVAFSSHLEYFLFSVYHQHFLTSSWAVPGFEIS